MLIWLTVIEKFILKLIVLVLLQHGADANVKNTDGKTPLDLADISCRSVLTGMNDNGSF